MPDIDNTNEQLSADEIAEQKEWDDALADLDPAYRKEETQEEQENEQTDPSETTTTTTTVIEDDPNTTTTTTVVPSDSGQTTTTTTVVPGDNDESDDDAGESEEQETNASNPRLAQREWAAEVKKVASEVKDKLYPELPKSLVDSEGDPINSIDDVMKLVNPRTKELFTEEEAGMWLLSAQQDFNQRLAGIDKQVEEIAETNLDLKDWVDSVTTRYGELLKQNPKLQDRLWGQYQKTLVRDKETDVIMKAPVNLEEFYDAALEPYVQLAEQLETKKGEDEAAEAARLAAEKETKERKRQDRSDIFGGGKTDNRDQDTKEWDDAAKAVFGSL